MAQSAVGKLQAKRLLEVVVKAKVTCSCFQGRFLTLRRPAKMTVEGGATAAANTTVTERRCCRRS